MIASSLPIGLDFQRDPAIGGLVAVAAKSPAKVTTDIAHYEPDAPVTAPLVDVHSFMGQ